MIGYIIKVKENATLPANLKHKLGIVISKYSGVASYNWIVYFDQNHPAIPFYTYELEILSKTNLLLFV